MMKKVVGMLSMIFICLVFMGCPQPTEGSSGDNTENTGNNTETGGETDVETRVEVPGIPAGINLTIGSDAVEVTWTAVDGATSYKVYCSKDNDSSDLTGEEVTTNSYTFEDDFLVGGYYFWIQAVNSAGSSELSDVSTIDVPLSVDLTDFVGTYTVWNDTFETWGSVTINADGSASIVSRNTNSFDPDMEILDYTITASITDDDRLLVLADSGYSSTYSQSKTFSILYDVTGTKTALYDGWNWFLPNGDFYAEDYIGDLTLSKAGINSSGHYLMTISHNLSDRISGFIDVEDLISVDVFASEITEYTADDAESGILDSDLTEENRLVYYFLYYYIEGLEDLEAFSLVVTPVWTDENADLSERILLNGGSDLFKAGLDVSANVYPDSDTPKVSLRNKFSFIGTQDIDSFSNLKLERKVPGESWITIEDDYKAILGESGGTDIFYYDETVELPNVYIYRVSGAFADGEEYKWESEPQILIPTVTVGDREDSNPDSYINISTYTFEHLEGADLRLEIIFLAPMGVDRTAYDQIVGSDVTSITISKPGYGGEIQLDESNYTYTNAGTNYYDVQFTYEIEVNGTVYSGDAPFLRYNSY